jgi:hypothetical protein
VSALYRFSRPSGAADTRQTMQPVDDQDRAKEVISATLLPSFYHFTACHRPSRATLALGCEIQLILLQTPDSWMQEGFPSVVSGMMVTRHCATCVSVEHTPLACLSGEKEPPERCLRVFGDRRVGWQRGTALRSV